MYLKWYGNDLLYLCIFVLITVFSKPYTDFVVIDILANVLILLLSLWYLNEVKIFTKDYLAIQIFHGIWCSVFILFLVIGIFFLTFHLHASFVRNENFYSNFILFIAFQGLVALSEELVFRKCFYTIFERTKWNDFFVIVFDSLAFGFLHYYLHTSVTQFVSAFIFSFIICIAQKRIRNFTLLSCICTHFIYDIFCCFLLFR